MKKSNKTDATQSRLGDDYHLLIVLQYCMASKDGDIVYIEKYGDISLNRKISIESKHHIDKSHKTGTYHKDIWKTIHNWIEEYEEYKTYRKLELISTSKLSDTNQFKQWNDASSPQKVKLLSSLASSPDVPTSSKKFTDTVIGFLSGKSLKEQKAFLSRIILNFNSSALEVKVKELSRSSFLKGLPIKNRIPYLHKLYGFIIAMVRHDLSGSFA